MCYLFLIDINEGKYTKEHVDEIINLLKDLNLLDPTTVITYPVRAGIAAQSIEEMLYLVNASQNYWPDSSLTLWPGGDDVVDISKLKELIELVGTHRCFTDLPFTIPEINTVI